MKNKKMVFGAIVFLFVIGGFYNVVNTLALDDPDYSVTLYAGQRLLLTRQLNAGETIRIEYEVTSGGNKDVDFYIEYSNGTKVVDLGRVAGYGLYYFDCLVNDEYTIVFSNAFSIITAKELDVNLDVVKSITVINPMNTDIFKSGDNYITWNSTGNIYNVVIQLYKNGTFLETISSGAQNDGSYTWFIYNNEYLYGDYYQILIGDKDDNTVWDYSDYFMIDCEIDKTITITNPISTDTFEDGYNDISWASTGDIDYVQIELYKNGVFLETIASKTSNDGSHSWYVSVNDYTDGSNYQIRISNYYDVSINDYSDYFTIECETDDPYIPDDPIVNIPSFDLLIVIGIIGSVSTISVFMIRKKINKKSKF